MNGIRWERNKIQTETFLMRFNINEIKINVHTACALHAAHIQHSLFSSATKNFLLSPSRVIQWPRVAVLIERCYTNIKCGVSSGHTAIAWRPTSELVQLEVEKRRKNRSAYIFSSKRLCTVEHCSSLEGSGSIAFYRSDNAFTRYEETIYRWYTDRMS